MSALLQFLMSDATEFDFALKVILLLIEIYEDRANVVQIQCFITKKTYIFTISVIFVLYATIKTLYKSRLDQSQLSF